MKTILTALALILMTNLAFGQCTGVFPANTVCGNASGSPSTPKANPASGLIAGKALTKTDDTNVTLTLGGTPTTALLQSVSITAGWTGTLAAARLNANVVQSIVNDTNIQGAISAQALTFSWAGTLSMARGGAGKALTAANGGIVYSDADSLEILAPTVTANQMLLSGASGAPAWSTATHPATTTINQLLYSSATNTIVGLATANGGILNAGATGVPAVTVTPVLGLAGTSKGTLGFSGNTSGVVTMQPAAAAGTWTLTLPTTAGASGEFLKTDGAGVTSWGAVAGSGTVTSITPGAGTVSSVTASCVLTAITVSGTISAAECVNAQTGTTYTVVDGDRAKIITLTNAASIAVTLPQAGATSAFQNGWFADFQNISASSIVTITPTTSTIGGAATLRLFPGQGARVVSDGTNYFVVRGVGGGSCRFSVNKGGTDQTGVADATFTQVTWSTEEYDICGLFASNVWTPPAGPVTLCATLAIAGTAVAGSQAALAITKNGATTAYKQMNVASYTNGAVPQLCADDVATGTDAYGVMGYFDVSAGTVTFGGGVTTTYFQGRTYH